MTTLNMLALFAAIYFNAATPSVQAQCAHASDADMVACVVKASIQEEDEEEVPCIYGDACFVPCTTDLDCELKNGGEY